MVTCLFPMSVPDRADIADIVVFAANTVWVQANTVVFFRKHSGILCTYGGDIFGANTAVLFGKKSGIWGQIQWYFGQIQLYL